MNRASVRTIHFLLLAFIGMPTLFGAQFSPIVERLEKKMRSARSSPAIVSLESGEALLKKGYVLIGQIRADKAVGSSCWKAGCDAALSCPSVPGKDSVNKELLEQAAAEGGDVVVLSKDNAVYKEERSKQGKCLIKAPTTKTVAYSNCKPAYRNSNGTYTPGPCTWGTRTITVKECTTWENLKGYGCLVASQGAVWRLDPDLPKRIAALQEKAAFEMRAAKENAEFAAVSAVQKAVIEARAEEFVGIGPPVSGSPTPFIDNGKWGYRDENGTVVIPPRFERALPFSEGLARIKVGDKIGFIDMTGALVIEARFDAATQFSEGLAAVGFGEKLLQWKHGYINKKGELVIPVQFDSAGIFSEGLAAVGFGENFFNLKYGYIDKKGELVIPATFDGANRFSEGLAAVVVGAWDSIIYKNRLWGYIDKSGKFSIKPAFYQARAFSEGVAPIAAGNASKYSWGYLNLKDNLFIEFKYEDADEFSDGLAKVKLNGKYGYIDRTGDLVFPPLFQAASKFGNGVARIAYGGKLAFLDKFGTATEGDDLQKAIDAQLAIISADKNPDALAKLEALMFERDRRNLPAVFYPEDVVKIIAAHPAHAQELTDQARRNSKTREQSKLDEKQKHIAMAEASLQSVKFVKVLPGTFSMGDKVSGPIHRVTITKEFEIQTTEVIQALWESVMEKNPSKLKGLDLPVETVSWNDVQEFIRRLNLRNDGFLYRLPTEAEWEYSYRAGSTDDSSIGLDAAWLFMNAMGTIHPGGQKKPNAWGIYDMQGNVKEWVQDVYGPHPAGDITDPEGASKGDFHTYRGCGVWSQTPGCSAALRFSSRPTYVGDDLGFRLVRTPR
jgi:formylglycine-generating enzyme required for sulfatase activity